VPMTAEVDEGIDARLCPSAPAQVGAVLLTVVGSDGAPAYIPNRLQVTEEFLAEADPATVEARFRFASPCRHSACAHWSQGACSIPPKLQELVTVDEPAQLPRCSIRRDCRWYAQAGFEACRRCPLVTRTEGAPASSNCGRK
jgi:hypothetical protein